MKKPRLSDPDRVLSADIIHMLRMNIVDDTCFIVPIHHVLLRSKNASLISYLVIVWILSDLAIKLLNYWLTSESSLPLQIYINSQD